MPLRRETTVPVARNIQRAGQAAEMPGEAAIANLTHVPTLARAVSDEALSREILKTVEDLLKNPA
jgi:hypothetical protein